MARKKVEKTDLDEINVQAEEVKVEKPVFETKEYTVIAAKWQVGDKLYKRGEKINLTKEAYKFYNKQFKVK